MGNKLNTVLLSIVVAIGAWQLSTTRSLELNSKDLKMCIEVMQKDIGQIKTAGWTTMHMKIWADNLERNNSALRVPDPAKIRKEYN